MHAPTVDPTISERDQPRFQYLITCDACGEQVPLTDEQLERSPAPGMAIAIAFLDHNQDYGRRHLHDPVYL